ncbi:MAG: NAD(P)/FAD-dependent oxidoreductase [Acinetobacter venetianus]|uniref:phytoene desaturase family protein n=1 Tax=Acinetobacter venetianus TaxID=52133 RepID=UPI003C72799F
MQQTQTLASHWDAIVIGGGIGGLSSAAFLATNGMKTLLLEQYSLVGGCSHVFRRKRQWEFDVGIHYIGDCGADGQVPRILRSLGLADRIEFNLMDSTGYDTIVLPDKLIKVPYGWDNYLDNLIGAFPHEEKGLRKFVGIISSIGMALDRSRTPASTKGLLKFALDAGVHSAWAMMPVTTLMDYCRLSEEARIVVSIQFGQYGCPPSRAPVVLHAGLLQNYIEGGAWYPKGGGQMFAGNLVEVIEAHNGAVRTQAKVERILLDNGKVSGVRLESGEEFHSKTVVSAADLKKTYLNMIGAENLPARFVKKVNNFTMTSPFMNVFLGLDIDLHDRMPNTNYFSVPTTNSLIESYGQMIDNATSISQDQWLKRARAELPSFIHSGSRKDPSHSRHAPPGCSSLESMTMVPAQYEFWTHANKGESYSKDSYYLELKEELTDILIQRVEDVMPGIKQHIIWKEAATPLTHERYTLSTAATAYGLEPNIKQFGPFRPRSKTVIPGLFIAGTSTTWGPSVEGTFISGLHAASAILGRDLDQEIRQGHVYADISKLPKHDSKWDPLKVSKVNLRQSRNQVDEDEE